ncbi:MAG: Uma2 family endonuclease [Alphaproteobacteria bacterium]|nr:Uma2 family endonuclease [Alphaproteobacteria bacterium]
MERSTGSMGSEYRSFHIDPEALPLFKDFDWNSLARRVFIDPVTGLIALMTPSSQHEGYAGGADRLVEALDRKYNLRAILLRSTRWRRSSDPKNTGAEPDASFYLGDKAERRAYARLAGEEALEAFEAATPPDLVVEVERSRGDEAKPRFYRELGVPEMWRIDIADARREVVILNLQAPDGPTALSASTVLPLCTPDFVLEALELAVDGRIRELDALIDHRAETEAREAGGGR